MRQFNTIIIRNYKREKREQKLSSKIWFKIFLYILTTKQQQQDLEQQALKINTRKLYQN